jgi:hypothetical protein
MRGKTAYKAYERGSRYGKFNSLYGTGDHPSEGGKIVDGVDGKIHVMGGVESDIMKANPKEGEYILMQKKGYNSFAEVPVSEDGNRMYGHNFLHKITSGISNTWDSITGSGAYGAMDAFVGGYLPGGMQPGEETWRGGMDKYFSDPLQQKFEIGEYSEEAKRNVSLEKMLGQQIGSAITGQGEMEGFIGEQLAEQKIQFGAKRGQLDIQTTGVQEGMGQYAGARDIEKQTGLITDTSPALEAIETQGEMQMANIGVGRTLLASQERGAETQADIDIARGKQRTQQSLASMLSDYMTATGETIGEGYLDMFTDYMEGNFTSVEDYT